MLSIPSIRSSILESLSLSLLPGTQNRDILGSWLVAALEEGRRAGGSGLRGWTESTAWLDQESTSSEGGEINLVPQLSELVRYLELSILDPPSLHDDIHPSPVQAAFQSTKPQPPTKGKKKPPVPPPVSTPVAPSTDDEEVAEERWTRYRVGGLAGLSWLLQQLAERSIPLPESLSSLLRNTYLWTVLSVEEEDTLGGKQPVIRRAGYALLETLVNTFPAEAEAIVEDLAVAVLDNCWREREATVWETAGSAVAKFLTSESTPHACDLEYLTDQKNTATPGHWLLLSKTSHQTLRTSHQHPHHPSQIRKETRKTERMKRMRPDITTVIPKGKPPMTLPTMKRKHQSHPPLSLDSWTLFQLSVPPSLNLLIRSSSWPSRPSQTIFYHSLPLLRPFYSHSTPTCGRPLMLACLLHTLSPVSLPLSRSSSKTPSTLLAG